MQIAGLRIENFRGIREGTIRFDAHTVFIGANNCGKTTVIEALALLFGRDRMVRGRLPSTISSAATRSQRTASA